MGFSRLLKLHGGYAGNDRGQGQKQPQLTVELVKKQPAPIGTANGAALSGGLGGNRGTVYRLRVIKAASPGTVVRQSMTELLVSYEQLTTKLQQLNRAGNRVIGVTAV